MPIIWSDSTLCGRDADADYFGRAREIAQPADLLATAGLAARARNYPEVRDAGADSVSVVMDCSA